jgi:hypothetical protein
VITVGVNGYTSNVCTAVVLLHTVPWFTQAYVIVKLYVDPAVSAAMCHSYWVDDEPATTLPSLHVTLPPDEPGVAVMPRSPPFQHTAETPPANANDTVTSGNTVMLTDTVPPQEPEE